jgi:hypothetical protein
VGIGMFGKVLEPQFFLMVVAGFFSGTAVTTWLATPAVTLGLCWSTRCSDACSTASS